MGQLTTGRLTPAAYYAAGGSLPADRARPNVEIFNFEISATNSPNRLGFFGANGAPNSPVIVGQFQSRSYRTDHVGADLGEIVNNKFLSSTTAQVSGVNFTASLTLLPPESGTLLARFVEPNSTLVVTRNGVFRVIDLTAGSGAPDIADAADGITVEAAQLQDTHGFAGNTTWTRIDSGGVGSPPQLSLADQAGECNLHDYHIIVSASPTAAGRKINFAYYMQLEFL
jgi:hypothetical protein